SRLAHGPTRKQVALDKWIEIPIQNPVRVAHLKLGAVILDEPVWMQDIRADLAAEIDVGLGGLEHVRSLATLAQLKFIKARAQKFHGHFLVAVLRAFVLALD